MTLKAQIDNDIKTALRGGDRFVSETLRGLKAAILNQEIATGKRDEGLNDAEVQALIAKEVKKRKESAQIYSENKRDDLAEKENAEIKILSDYLPKQLSEQEIINLITELTSQNSIDLIPQNMGKIIGLVKSKVGASADGALVAKLVQQITQK